jgi:uncharacterized protein YgbK (DUF1537 family)
MLDWFVKRNSPCFMLGSSGIEYALTQFWEGETAGERPPVDKRIRPTFGPVEQLVVITGSCSPVNDRQITWAENNGFETLEVDPAKLINEQTWPSELARVTQLALARLNRGVNLILHTSRGPNDPRIASAVATMKQMGLSDLEIRLQSGQLLGPKLGRILKGILSERSFARVAIAGGDTSGYIARELGLEALEAIAPVAPGSPLCRAYAMNSLNGMEFIFKGGQVGKDDVWGCMLNGT